MTKIILFLTTIILTTKCCDKTPNDRRTSNASKTQDTTFSKTILQKINPVNQADYKTNKYAGIYVYGPIKGSGRIGEITIYPESDTTILFYIYLDKGAPSNHEGSLYGETKVIDGVSEFYTRVDNTENGCRWAFNFVDKKLTLTTMNDEGNCGFGYAVYSDGIYKRKSSKIPAYFNDMTKTKVYFKNTKPSDYNSE